MNCLEHSICISLVSSSLFWSHLAEKSVWMAILHFGLKNCPVIWLTAKDPGISFVKECSTEYVFAFSSFLLDILLSISTVHFVVLEGACFSLEFMGKVWLYFCFFHSASARQCTKIWCYDKISTFYYSFNQSQDISPAVVYWWNEV